MISIYERQSNVKQLSIDNLPYRKSVNSRKVWFDKPASRKCKCMHITQDYHDKSRHLKTMDLHQVNYNETKIDYYLDIESGKVWKLRDYINRNKNLIYSNIYHGTKTQAQKRLARMI